MTRNVYKTILFSHLCDILGKTDTGYNRIYSDREYVS
jgi:hypothetical protein